MNRNVFRSIGNQQWLERLWPSDALYAFYRDITRCTPPDLCLLKNIPYPDDTIYTSKKDNIRNGNAPCLAIQPCWGESNSLNIGLTFKSKSEYMKKFSYLIFEVNIVLKYFTLSPVFCKFLLPVMLLSQLGSMRLYCLAYSMQQRI